MALVRWGGAHRTILVVATDAVKDSPTSVRVDVTASARVRSSMLVAVCNRCVMRAGIRELRNH